MRAKPLHLGITILQVQTAKRGPGHRGDLLDGQPQDCLRLRFVFTEYQPEGGCCQEQNSHCIYSVKTSPLTPNFCFPGAKQQQQNCQQKPQLIWTFLKLYFPSPGDLPNPGIEPRSPALREDSLPTEPPGKSKNTGVGSLSLLQGIFPTQELKQGLLHCTWFCSRKTSASALLNTLLLLYWPKPLTVWITINCGKFLKR